MRGRRSGTRRCFALEPHPQGHGALSREVVPAAHGRHALWGEPVAGGPSSTARRPNADLPPGAYSPGPEALGQPGTDGHRPGPPLPA